jgi:hypothetical protein
MKTRGNTLAATLVAVAIILILVVVFFVGPHLFGNSDTAGPPRKDNLGTTVPGRVRYGALDDECKSDLDQVRQFITLKQNSSEDDKPPASLDEAGVPANIRTCPVGHEPYVYDPVTGKVHCPHPGHENY